MSVQIQFSLNRRPLPAGCVRLNSIVHCVSFYSRASLTRERITGKHQECMQHLQETPTMAGGTKELHTVGGGINTGTVLALEIGAS
jgi:hypothetical protein